MNKNEKLKALLAEAANLEKKGDSLTEEDVTRAEELSGEITALKAEIAKTAKTSAALRAALKSSGPVHEEESLKGATVGDRFVHSPAMKAFRDANPNGVDGTPVNIRVKGLGSFGRNLKADDDASTDSTLTTTLPGAVQVTRLPGVDDLTYRNQPVFLNLVTRGTTASDHVEYRQLISVTNNAAVVAEKGEKPLSALDFQLAQANGHTYADGFKVTNQELKDDGIISNLINTTLKTNLDTTIENILLNGSGTNEPAGILNMTGTLNQDYDTDAITTIRKAISTLQNTSKATIQAIVLNPTDIEAIDLMKDSTGRYLGQGPFGIGPRTLWGVPLAASQSVAEGTAILGDFTALQLLDYESLSITAFNQNEDDARHNLTYIRAEQRSLLLCREPAKLLVASLKTA
jgi:HK97 family phage major capsid protein